MPDPLPRRDVEFAHFAANFVARTADLHERLPLAPGELAALIEAQDDWAAAYLRATTPATATSPAVAEKRATRELLETRIRPIAQRARALPDITDAELRTMGLRRRAPRRKAIPVPARAPELRIVSTLGRRITARVKDADSPTRLGMPRDVHHAVIYYQPGAAPSDRLEDWKLCRTSTRATFTIDLPLHLPVGTLVWVMARWSNYMCEMGPASRPTGASINYAGPSARAGVLAIGKAA